MKILKVIFTAIFLLHCSVQASIRKPDSTKQTKKIASNDDGLALTPPMCFSTWNTFKMNPTEDVVKGIADMILEKGFKDAGYEYVNIDEGWASGRDKDGQIKTDSIKFPNGMKAIADYIHSKGLKAGIYTNLGTSVKGDLGSRGYYEQDMKTFASWGFDYIKVDVNFIKNKDIADLSIEFADVSKAIKKCGRPMVFSICNQGFSNPTNWAPTLGNMWRVGKDIDYLSWAEPYQKTQWQGVLYELDRSMEHPEAARPGAWNDADMMLVGVTKEADRLILLTPEEAKSHFSLWCIINSPLNIGADIRNISEQAKNILTNKEVIAINQDAYGEQARIVNNIDNLQVYSKHLESANSGKRGVVLFNRTDKAHDITVSGSMLGLNGKFFVRDLWLKQKIGTFNNYTVNVPPHGVVFLKIISN